MADISGETFKISHRRALVTGASSGLGEHFAKVLAAAGVEVVLAARRVDKLRAVAEEITSAGGSAHCIEMDVGSSESVTNAFSNIEEIAGGVCDILINNAGIVDGGWFYDASEEEWSNVINTNLLGVWRVAKSAARAMQNAKQPGAIVNLASITGLRPFYFSSAYGTSKAAVNHLTRLMALELSRHKIRVNALAPGYLVTPLNREYLLSEDGEKMKRRIAMRRFADHHELNGALLLLVSDAGSYITGSTIVVDGGHSLTPL